MRDINSKGKLIMIMGAPSSGKSTLAAELHTELKKMSRNSIFVSEVATDYIAEYGIPNSPIDQMVIFYKQLNKEIMFLESKDYVICDSSSILNYFYFRQLFSEKLSKKDIASINHLQKEILKHINTIDQIFYVPPIVSDDVSDGIRYHNEEQITKIDRWIKSYLELENIGHIDLSNISREDRIKFILSRI
jgi:tRNA uridine 5-carbamoylmethylation protein Kti12